MNSEDELDLTLAELTERERDKALKRFTILQPHLLESVSLSEVATRSGTPIRTIQRWLSRYRASGLAGLVRSKRADAGNRKIDAQLVELVEGLALQKPRLPIAAVYRKVVAIARKMQWPTPSYSSVYGIVSTMDPAMVVLAQEGQPAFRDRFEIVFRHRTERPNVTWQADHTRLDIMIVDANGSPVRPWLTTVIDDYSRAVAGYLVFLSAPSSLHTSLALRQAIWRKQNQDWPMCGIPDVLYVDHGSDFTSKHLEQVAADLHFQIIFSTVKRPQGRGKVERLFGTLNTELLTELPGRLSNGQLSSPPRLSLSELDAAIGEYISGTYHTRKHSEINTSPLEAWIGGGWLPRMPDSLEALDLLLVMVAKSRLVRRDGIHFQGLRYMDPLLAEYVGEPVTIRYDPRDITEIRVFHRNKFLCRAISPEHSEKTITLKDIQSARAKYRRFLRGEIDKRVSRVTHFLPIRPQDETQSPKATPKKDKRRSKKLLTYLEDKQQ